MSRYPSSNWITDIAQNICKGKRIPDPVSLCSLSQSKKRQEQVIYEGNNVYTAT